MSRTQKRLDRDDRNVDKRWGMVIVCHVKQKNILKKITKVVGNEK